MPKLFSEVVGVTAKDLWREGAFDAFVDIDARFHIDPHLLETTKIPELATAHQRVKDYFENVLRLLRASKRPVREDPLFRNAWKRLQFPEFPYVSLGYGNKFGGNGIGEKLAFAIAETSFQIIKAGIDDPVIFELAGILENGIGADRISDMVAQIIAGDLLAFSQRVAKNLQLKIVLRDHGSDLYEIPFDPTTKKPVILMPHEILRPLPIALTRSEIGDVCAYNERLREALNKVIGTTWQSVIKKMTKPELKELLLSQPEMLRELILRYKESPSQPYDFARDPEGIMIWYEKAKEWAELFPLLLENVAVVSPDQVRGVVLRVCEHYGRLFERFGLNLLLFNDDEKLRKERFARLLFFGMAEVYCKANNLDLSLVKQDSREMILFKISRGYRVKLFVTVKYSSNPYLCRQYEEAVEKFQQPMKEDEIIFLVVRTAVSAETLQTLRKLRDEAIKDNRPYPELIIIDGRINDRTRDYLWEMGVDDDQLIEVTNVSEDASFTENGKDNKSKKGPRNYSIEEKLAALDEWNQLDRDKTPIKIDDWLEERFGTDGGVLNVARSTFYGWKRYRHKNEKSEKSD